MLSGKAPFQTRHQDETPAGIIKRIKEGEFEFTGQEWDAVSASAKKLIRGKNLLNNFSCYDCFTTHIIVKDMVCKNLYISLI